MAAAVTDFMAITGCESEEEASRILLMYDNDLNRAVDRYFNQKNRHQSSTRTVPPAAAAAPASSSRSNDSDDIQIIEPMDTSNDAPGPSRRRNVPTSSRRQMTVRNPHPIPSAPVVNNIDDDEEGIRQPIRPVTGQLINESFQQSWRAGVSRPTNGIFQSTTDFRTLARQHQGHANRVNGGPPTNGTVGKPRTLQTLFQPPVNLIFIGPWEAARQVATERNQWLLVNLQNNSEFACACLNRDIWNKETVQEVVKKNFVFWQVADDSPDCKRVSSYYNVTSFPSVLIIDPRTGEALANITRLKDAVSFLEALMEFLERFPDFASYDQSFVSNLGKAGPSEPEDVVIEEAAVSGMKKKAPKRKSDFDDEEDGSSSKKSKVVATSQNSTASAIDVDMGEIDELCNNGTKLTTVDREEWRNFVGPQIPGSQKVQIIFRLPNNEREKMEVPDTTQLRALFVFLDGRGLNSRDHVLVLTYPRREYFFDRHSSQTLRELGFNSQELIHVDRK